MTWLCWARAMTPSSGIPVMAATSSKARPAPTPCSSTARTSASSSSFPPAVGGKLELLADVRAVEEHGVGAGLAFDDVAAITGIPDEGVIARAQQSHVIAAAAVDQIVAVAAEQEVSAIATGEGVIARAAVGRDADECCQAVAGGERVIAAVGVEDEIFAGADVDAEGSGTDAIEADARAVGGNG